MHVIEGHVPSVSDQYIHEHILVKTCRMHDNYCREHWEIPTGHSLFPSQVDMHVASLDVNVCMKSVYSKTTSWYSSGTRDTVNHTCVSGHSLAGCCQVSLQLWEAWLHALRWHLHLPNVVQSFLSKSTQGVLFHVNKKELSEPVNRLHFFFALCILCVHDRD